MRHRPGKGLVVGLCGLAAILLSLVVPWFSAGGEDVTFSDLHDAFDSDEHAPTVNPETVTVPELDPQLSPTTTFIDPSFPKMAVPTARSASRAAPSSVSGAAAPAAQSDQSADELRTYFDWAWMLVLYLSVTGVVFAAWWVPSDRGLRMVTGFLVGACLGLIVNAVDKDGSSAPRVTSGLAALYGVFAHLAVFDYLFIEPDNAPDPGIGAFLAVAGSIAVLVGCVMGTRREMVPAGT